MCLKSSGREYIGLRRITGRAPGEDNVAAEIRNEFFWVMRLCPSAQGILVPDHSALSQKHVTVTAIDIESKR
jgi:hypothetical protein